MPGVQRDRPQSAPTLSRLRRSDESATSPAQATETASLRRSRPQPPVVKRSSRDFADRSAKR